MKYAPSSLSLSILIAGLLAGTAIVTPQTVSAAASDLQAQTGWAITRVASMSQGSYCTMAQKFNNDTVMTIAKNNGGEYSLAFDFQSPKFQPGRTTTVSVKAGGGALQTFEAQPTSPQAIVIGIGADESFINNVKSSSNVQLEIGGDSYSFTTVKFSEAQDEMATCMSSMKPQVREAKNAVPPEEPKSEAQKAEAAEAQKVASVAAAPAPEVSPANKLSAEDLTAAPVEPLKAPIKAAKAVAVPVPSAPAPEIIASSSYSEDAALRSENARLKQSLEEARRTYENQMTSQQGARVPELQEKIRALDMENSKLKDEVAKNTTNAQSKEDLARVAGELDKARKELAAATEQNKALQIQVADAVAGKQDAAKTTQAIQQSQRELETLKAENQTLKNQLQIASKVEAPAPAPVAPSADTAKLKAENDSLKAQLAQAVATVNSAAVSGKAIVADPAQEQEIAYLRAENEKLVKDLAAVKPAAGKPLAGASAELQKRVSELQTENASLKAQVANADTLTPMPAEAPLSASDQDNLRGQIRDLRSQLEIVESESAGLRKQLETAQKESEGKQIKAAGGSWDLEQATRRYQESQREIRRLGGLLEEDRVKCAQEKKDIEYMLFDPEVAKPAQISMLNNLEDQIQEKDSRIAQLEGSLKSAGIQPAPDTAKFAAAAPAAKVESEQLLSADMKPMTEKAPEANKVATKLEAPISPATVVAAAAAPMEPAPVTPTPVASAEHGKFQSSQDFTGILKSAGVTIRGAVQAVPKVASDTYKAYSWQTDSLYGSAEQRAITSQSAFEPAVQQYIDRAKSRCTGDFAAVPAQIKGTIPAEGYEIACVTGQSGSSASVLFTYKDGVMTTVAHEGRAEAMDIAMDARDRVASKIVAN